MKEKEANQKKIRVCSNCVYCTYIGEGDYICDLAEPVLVMEDFLPKQ